MRKLLVVLVLSILTLPAVAEEPFAPIELEVDLSAKTLLARVDGETVQTWTVAVGSTRHPTPPGEYVIRKMIWNPGWVPPDSDWAEGAIPREPGDPENPMRVVKIFFRPPDYYIHGTNRPETLGTAASHGCVRMAETDVLVLGRMIMEHSGEYRSPGWFRRVFTSDTSHTVYLGKPVKIKVGLKIDPEAEDSEELGAASAGR